MSAVTRTNGLSNLPHRPLFLIFSLLPNIDKLHAVSRLFHKFFDANARDLCHRSFGSELTEATKKPTTSYKHVYFQLSLLRTPPKTISAEGLPIAIQIPPMSSLKFPATEMGSSCPDYPSLEYDPPGSPPSDLNPLADMSDSPYNSDASCVSLRNQPLKIGSTDEEIDDLSNSLHQHCLSDDSVPVELKRPTPRERTPKHSLQPHQFRNPNCLRYPHRKKGRLPAAQTLD